MDYKEYLDKARIKQLAELQARYNQVYAKERAEAASSLIAGHRQLRRGLQNVGLAGRKGNLISGREKTAALEARRRYREYNAGLSRAANTFTTAAGQRMARQAIDDENRAKRAEAYAKWGDEYAAAKAEAEQEYAAKLEEAKQEHLQYAQEYQNSYNAYLAQQAQYQAWLQQQAAAQQGAQQELIDPRFQGNNMQQAKQDLLAARADQQRLQAEIQRLQMQQMAQDGVDPRLSGAQNTQQAKLQAATAARLNTLQRQYASLQEKIQRAEGITKPQNRNEYEIWRDAQNAQAKLNEQAQYAANMQKWQATINQAANITKPKNRYENEALKEAELARQQMAKAQAEMARKEMASKVTGMAGVLLQLSDEEFKLRYDAAERAYKLALQNAKILRQDSSSSMDDLSSDADRIEAQATQNFVAFEQANALREQVSEGNLYWNTFKPDAHNEYNKPSVRLIGNLNKGEFQTPIRTQDYLNAVKEYNPQAYNKMHDTDSKYAAAIHEYGRLGVLDSMNVSDAARDLLDYDETFLGKALRHSYADAYDVAMALVMTDEEKNRFDSFLANGQDDKADKYFEYLRDSGILDARAMQLMGNRLQAGIKDEIEKNGKLGLILSTLWTIPANVANGLIQPIASMFDTSASPYQASIRDIPNVMREAISQNLSQGGAFAYQTGMSIGDSLMSMALGGRIGGVALGGAAYNSAYREAINRGLSAEEARLTAFGTGFNEMLFETLSIGTLLEKTGKSAIKASRSAFVNWLVNTAVQAGVEGSEEVFTDIANNLWDKSVNGIVSEELTSIREYMSQGMTLQQAKAKVQREHAMQLGMSFLGGALSGGVMAGVGQGVNAFMNRRIDQYGKQIVNGEADVDIATLEKFDYKSEQAQEILNSGKLTNTDYGTLAILRVQELVQRSEAYINQAVAEGKMPQQIADIYKTFAEHSVQTETNPDGITDEEAEKMMPYVDVIKNAEAIKQGLGKIVEQQTAARKEFDALSSEQKQQRLQNITNETTALRNAPSLRVGARESRLSGQSAAQEFTTRAKTDTITLNNDGSVKTANGSVTFDFGANKTVDAMTDNQARAIRFAAAVANKTGVNIKVEQEFVGDDRNKNGEYNPETNTIRINLSGTNSAIYTMSHELTHYLQANNKQAFSDLSKAIQKQLSRTDLVGSDLPADYQDIIGDYLTGDNTLFEALCAYEKERYAKEKINLTQAQVEEEVIARCCESFLGNSSLVADMTQNHTKSARAVYRFLSEIRADINALRSDASERMAERGYASDFSPEQGMLEQFADIDKIVKLWENGLRKVAKKNKASGEKMASLSDTQYLDLAKRYESGDKSAEAELRKAVQRAASRNGYVLSTFHGTSEYFNTFNVGTEGIHLGTEAVAKQVASIRYNNRSKQTAYRWRDLRGRIKEIGTEAREEILKKAWDDANDYTDANIEQYNGSVNDDASVVQYVDRVENALDRKHGYSLYLNTFDRKVGERVIPLYAKINNPLVINGDIGYWNPFDIAETILDMAVGKTSKESAGGRPINITGSEVKLTKEQKRALLDISQLSFVRFTEEKFRRAWNELANVFESMGYDGIKYRNEFEGNKNSYSYIALRPTDVKSADLITKDDSGNIIPLSERFNTENEDIRFSLKDNVERKGDLIAVHNLSGDQLLRSIELGGFPMPSIAVMKQSQGHDRYGDVSVIFNKDTIDPKKSTANKVYGGDAWTPTYPTVEYKPRKTVADRISKTYFNIARQYGYDAARPLYSYVYELERKLNNAGSEKALLDDLYNDIDMMRLYGQINGKERVEDVYQETRTEMSDTDKAVPQYLINALGEDFIRDYATPEGENPLQHRKEFIAKHIKELDRVFGKMLREEFSFDEAQMLNVVENMTTREYMAQLQRALKIVNNDTVKIERVYDKGGTEKAVRNSIDEKAYKEWLYDLFHGIIEKSGIRNNKNYYTDTGNQRSWDALHYDETLENVVRVMRDMSDKGSNTFFSQSEMLALGTRNFKSISDIREHKGQLQHITDEEMSAAKTNIVNRFGDLMDEMRDKSESNYFIGRDRALQAMVEAVRRSRTPQGILNELRQWHGLNVTDDMGRRIADLMDEIADLPTEYFEAKPRRAVGLDEIKAVIMPQGEYAELKTKLDERGIPVVEYEKDNAEDRLRALNSDAVSEQRFSIMDKVRLSTSDGTRTFTYGDVTAKMWGNDVTLDGGKVRQRVQMLETLAERYDHVTVDASSEAEARAFENAGAKRVADEFSTGNEYGTYEFKFVESQFKRDSQFDAKQKANFAKAVLKQVGSRRNFTDQQMVKYRAALERAMTYLWNSTYGKGDQMAAFDAVDRLFDRILNGYSEMTEADADMRDALMSQMTKLKTANGITYYQLDVTETQMSEIRNAHGDLKTYANLLSKALGARVVVKQVDGARMLENTFTHATDSRIKNDTVEGNMPEELLRLAQDTMARRTNPYKSESNERAAKKEAMWDAALNIIGGEKSTQQKIREAVKEARAAERNAAKDKTAKAVDEARLAERMHEGALRAKDRRVMAERESDLKRRSVDREARLKQQFRETTARTNEERLKRDMRKAALKWNQRLVKLLANPTEASHVPVQLAREVAELTKTITEYIDSGTERGRINLDKIAKAYQQAFDDQATIRAAKKENIKYDPRGSVIDREMYDEQLVNMIDEMNDILADKSFKELSAREMMGLLNIIRGVAHTVYDANRMIGTTERKAIWQVGDKMVKELESAPKIKGSFARFFLEESLDLRRIAKVFSGSNENAEFVKLSDMLNRGAIEKERVARVLSGMFDPLTQQYGDEIRKWYGKNAEWIDTGITKNGRKVEITKGMRVSLAMHVLNAGNMRHIENGGVTIPSRELYAKGKLADAYANGTLVRLNADQINTIISQMTEAERAYVEVAKDFFHQRTGYYVNKTSLQLLGYRKATVENYFPIHTDRNYTKSDFASVVRDGSIEGQGFLKERVMASNPVYLEDITSVVNRQIKGVSLYAGLAVPMRNFNAVMNASVYEDENGNWVPRTTVRKAMTQSMGEYGAKVVQGFLQDVSGMSAVDVTPGEQLVAKLQTRYVKAVLLANLKVTLKQAASYPTAAAVIPWKYLSKALLKGGRNHRLISRADVDLINQYTPLYKMRLDGMANEITSIMAERGLEQKMPWLLGWITKMDVATVGRLWSAAEHMVADQQNLPVGSDEYYKAVAEVFNQTIQQTQPNFTPLQRNAALRSKNPVVRTLTLFGTQRMQNGGILIESAMELAHSKNMSKEAQAAAKAKFGRAVVSQLVQNVMLVAIGLVVDALRGRMTAWQDDDKDVTLESVAKVMGDQFLGNIFGSFLGGSEVWDIVSTAFKRATNANAYDTEFTVPSLDAIETIIGFFNKDSVSFVQYMSGDHTAEEKIARLKSFSFKVAKAAGYLTGFPFENIAKTIVKGWIPALQDIYDATQTGELIPWLHQSGKLDKAKTAANYKAWTKAGYSGRDYFYWEKQLNGVSGGRDGRIPILLDSDLTNEQKALMMQMFDTADGYADGTVFYNKKGEAIIDFTAPSEKQQALPKPNEEPSEAPNAEPTAEPTPKPTENPLTEARQEGVQAAVKLGVPEQTAFDAFLAYQNMGKNKDESDGYSRNDEFREWLFKNVDSPEQMAVLEYQVIGQASSVKGAITYRDSGVVYRDYTNESWFKLSEHNLAKDGTNKRYEAGKQLEKTGLKVDKTVAIYDGLKELTKKAEWIDYLKNQNLNDDQIRIFLWSRGWKY